MSFFYLTVNVQKHLIAQCRLNCNRFITRQSGNQVSGNWILTVCCCAMTFQKNASHNSRKSFLCLIKILRSFCVLSLNYFLSLSLFCILRQMFSLFIIFILTISWQYYLTFVMSLNCFLLTTFISVQRVDKQKSRSCHLSCRSFAVSQKIQYLI